MNPERKQPAHHSPGSVRLRSVSGATAVRLIGSIDVRSTSAGLRAVTASTMGGSAAGARRREIVPGHRQAAPVGRWHGGQA